MNKKLEINILVRIDNNKNKKKPLPPGIAVVVPVHNGGKRPAAQKHTGWFWIRMHGWLLRQGLFWQFPNGAPVVELTWELDEQNGGKRPPLQKHVGWLLINRHVELFKHGFVLPQAVTTVPEEAVLLPGRFGAKVAPFCGNSHRLPEKFGRHMHRPKFPIVRHVPPSNWIIN